MRSTKICWISHLSSIVRNFCVLFKEERPLEYLKARRFYCWVLLLMKNSQFCVSPMRFRHSTNFRNRPQYDGVTIDFDFTIAKKIDIYYRRQRVIIYISTRNQLYILSGFYILLFYMLHSTPSFSSYRCNNQNQYCRAFKHTELSLLIFKF